MKLILILIHFLTIIVIAGMVRRGVSTMCQRYFMYIIYFNTGTTLGGACARLHVASPASGLEDHQGPCCRIFISDLFPPKPYQPPPKTFENLLFILSC